MRRSAKCRRSAPSVALKFAVGEQFGILRGPIRAVGIPRGSPSGARPDTTSFEHRDHDATASRFSTADRREHIDAQIIGRRSYLQRKDHNDS